MVGFILKVFVVSTLISIAIKQGGPYLPVAATNTTALVTVITPSILFAVLLSWRWQKQQLER
uniref:Uncharacterized protein n=1 Tax=Oscillatoriales cyanobacterium SpSt-402 TaxID=2282168 RepID=A0A832H2D9_9CYAN